MPVRVVVILEVVEVEQGETKRRLLPGGTGRLAFEGVLSGPAVEQPG